MKNYEKLFEIAKKNTIYNSEGYAVVKKDDEWVDETEWDSHIKEEKIKNEYRAKIKRNMAGAVSI